MPLDRRLNAYRPDLASVDLKGKVEADRFVEPVRARIAIPVADLRPKPDGAAGIDTQLMLGESVKIFDRADGWAWIQSDLDSYVGYLREEALADSLEPGHWVIAPRTFVYPEPELKRPALSALSMGSRVAVTGEIENRGTLYATLADGSAVIASHLLPVGEVSERDYVHHAARLLETPYLWGGRTAFGIDCSGLVQLAMTMAGRTVLRDSDMQAAAIGTEIGGGDLIRGDLVFWKGHVGIMEDPDTMLHANGHTMSVAREALGAAIARIEPVYGRPTGYRRPL